MKESYIGTRDVAAKENLWTTSFVFTILVNFLAYLGNFMLLPTLPLHVLNIGGNKIMAGLVSGIYYLTGFISRPKVGGLLDQKGRKPIMLAESHFITVDDNILQCGGTFSHSVVNIESGTRNKLECNHHISKHHSF